MKTRLESRKPLKHSRYLRVTLLVNLRRSSGRTVKVDQMARGLCLPAAIHLGITSGKHLIGLELALPLLLKLTSTHPRSTTGFGCFGCRWWLQQLGGWQQRGQLFGTLAMVAVVAAVVAGAAWLSIDEAWLRFGDLAACEPYRIQQLNLRRVRGQFLRPRGRNCMLPVANLACVACHARNSRSRAIGRPRIGASRSRVRFCAMSSEMCVRNRHVVLMSTICVYVVVWWSL